MSDRPEPSTSATANVVGPTRRRLRQFIGGGLLITAFAVAVAAIVANEPAGLGSPCDDASDGDGPNVQVQLRSEFGGYEIELWSEVEFPVRALPPILRIGLRDVLPSRYGEDGSLHTLIFYINDRQFDDLTSGEPVSIYYGSLPANFEAQPELAAEVEIADPAQLWTFGRFDKSRLDCPARPLPPEA